MAGNRPADWHVLDLDKDPTPGDPDRVRNLAKNLHDFADDVSKVLRDIKGMAGEDAILTWAGKTAESFTSEFESAPGKLKKLKKSYEMAGDALSTYWPELERSQALADKALAKGREAQTSLSAAQTRLTSADSWVDRAGKEADKYKDDKDSGVSKDVPKPDPDKVKAATRNANSAEKAQTAAKSDVTAAQSSLDAAKKMAEDARKMREDAAGTAKKKLEDASDAGIQNRKWWEEVGDWVTDNWDTIVAVCKVVVAVLGIIAMIIGGPILGAIVLIAALVVLADTLNKYANGEAGLLDVAFAALDCIPGMKGLTSLRGLAKGLKGLKGLKTGMKGLALGAKGLGKGTRAMGRQMKKLFTCGDPIDMATGEMVMSATDVALPGVLPLLLERHHRTSTKAGRWFGPSWTSTLDQRLILDKDGVRFISDDGMVLHYPVPDPDEPTQPVEGPRWPLFWDGVPGSAMTLRQPESNRTLHFQPVAGSSPSELPLSAISDRNDNTITISYGENGEPQELVHDGGYHVGVSTDRGRVTAFTLLNDADQPTLLRYAYDSRGNLAEIYNSSGIPLKLFYDERRRIDGWEDRNNTWYRYEYDDTNHCVRTTGTSGILDYTYIYDTEANTTLAVNSLGHTTTYQFNDALQLCTETDPLGHITAREWTRYDQLLSLTDPLGRTTSYDYDLDGNLTHVTHPDGATVVAEYNELGLPARIIDPDGVHWLREYDARGNLTSETDPVGSTTELDYDELGHLRTVTDALGNAHSFLNDAAGLIISTTNPLSAATRIGRDSFGRVASVCESSGEETRYGWTVEGEPSWRIDPDGSRSHWKYDAEGNLIEHADPERGVTRYEIGGFDQPSRRVDPDGRLNEFTYDTELRLTGVTTPLGTWTYEYDGVGNLVREGDFNGRLVQYQYDAARQLIARINGAEQRIEYVYDPRGATVGHSVGGNTTSFEFDINGMMVRASNPESEIVFERDACGRSLIETCNGRILERAYDALGRTTLLRTPSGLSNEWTWGPGDRLASLQVAGRTLTFEYDTAGRELERRLNTGVTLRQEWGTENRLTSQSLINRAGEITKRREFSYRADGYLTGISDSGNEFRNFALDHQGRVTAVDAESWTEEYAYDAAGNLSQAVWPDGSSGTEPQGSRRYEGSRLRETRRDRYEYDGQGRVVRHVRKLLSGGRHVWRYTWDAYDRLTQVVTPDGRSWYYLYDALGRRIAKQLLADDEETVASQTIFTWDGSRLAEQEQITEAPEKKTITWGWEPESHRPITQVERTSALHIPQAQVDEQFFEIVTDLIGTPTELVDDTGDVAWRSSSNIWGSPIGDPLCGDTDCPLRFPGQYYDAESGLHYNLFRYYDPAIGCYYTPDSLGLAPAPNPYSYPANPLLWADPLGLTPCVAKQLSKRASEIHAQAGHPIAQSRSTVAVIRARTPYGDIDVVAGSGRGLNKTQEGMLRRGEMLADNIDGTHAEQNAMLHIIKNGWTPVAGGASRSVCDEVCAPLIRASGGRITGDVFQRESGTKIRTFLW
ncbi:DUF6531 domain-containing protein [Streptomyces sp. NPDC058268]|uniref:DUF6531 domain-containing protein n=1 Tax=Streptomyces sp. NPDC058268 TaxID=3346413 RepID=UPI0036EBA94E